MLKLLVPVSGDLNTRGDDKAKAHKGVDNPITKVSQKKKIQTIKIAERYVLSVYS